VLLSAKSSEFQSTFLIKAKETLHVHLGEHWILEEILYVGRLSGGRGLHS
jgi:hypothetical protein